MNNLDDLISQGWPELSSEIRRKILHFHTLLVEENQRQNLTRLISPQDFFEGHLLDVKELLASRLVSFPALDIGSGAGVPGLLAAIIQEDTWFLVDSENRKAEFLERTVQELKLKPHVKVFSGRAEDFLIRTAAASLVVRAVGPVDKIFRWVSKCSTWNNLVLLKGPAWEKEWQEAQGSLKDRLEASSVYSYQVGIEKKERVIVRLERVPRRT